jgi:SnoaL-like domain
MPERRDLVSEPELADRQLAGRIERIEASLAIQQLAIRYAMAVDARDLDAWVGCFRPDVDMGRHGTGREALRRYIDPMVRRFYRSVHQICGHRIELADPDPAGGLDRAAGAVYCRAEHEVGEEWIVMAICYFDEYARVDGEWFFSRRRERHWYAADVTRTPQSAGFAGWAGSSQPKLPAEFASWAPFWDRDTRPGTLTKAPEPPTAPATNGATP